MFELFVGHFEEHFPDLSGRLDTDLPVTYNQKVGQHWHMEVQGGGPEVRFDSISGTMHVNGVGNTTTKAPATEIEAVPAIETESASPESSAPVSESDSPIAQAAETRRDILDRVARGELSVDEAIDKLRG